MPRTVAAAVLVAGARGGKASGLKARGPGSPPCGEEPDPLLSWPDQLAWLPGPCLMKPALMPVFTMTVGLGSMLISAALMLGRSRRIRRSSHLFALTCMMHLLGPTRRAALAGPTWRTAPWPARSHYPLPCRPGPD